VRICAESYSQATADHSKRLDLVNNDRQVQLLLPDPITTRVMVVTRVEDQSTHINNAVGYNGR
jgi:hypothetical protein